MKNNINHPFCYWLSIADSYKQRNLDPNFDRAISTKDLISQSFQIARGMDYLAKKKVQDNAIWFWPHCKTPLFHDFTSHEKVLHGDLAARNILLADDGIAKVADFGMARKMYYEENYEKNGQVIQNSLNL